MATRIFGAVEPFDPDSMSWTTYCERMEEFFVANEVEDERKQVAMFISLIGTRTYELLKDLCLPELPNTKSFSELVDKLKSHYQPKPTVISERYQFHKRDQKGDESIAEYFSALRRLTEHCKFNNFLDEALRDRLVCGIRSAAIRKRLLTEHDLEMDKAFQLARNMETVDIEASKMSVERIGIKNNDEIGLNTSDTLDEKGFRVERKGVTQKSFGRGPRENFNKSHFKQRKQITCFRCGRLGHMSYQCYAKNTTQVREVEEDSQCLDINSAREEIARDEVVTPKRMVQVKIGKKVVEMEMDTGAAVSVISRDALKVPYKKSDKKLRSASGQLLRVAGETVVKVQLDHRFKVLKLYIVNGPCPSLFGRSWIRAFYGDHWAENLMKGSSAMQCSEENDEKNEQIDVLKNKFRSTVFNPKLGTIVGIKADLTLKENFTPKFQKARPVPFALKEKIETTLEKMVSEGNIEKISHSDWASPIVPVLKPNGDVRVCGDYKATVNPCLKMDQFPLPKIEECFNAVSGGKKFTKLDLKQAFNQIPLSEESKSITTMNTTKGLYRWLRLPFGISSSPGIFANVIDKVLHGLKFVAWYQDDIIVTGIDDQQHLSNLETVLKRLEEFGLRVSEDKCSFMKEKLEYLGFVISRNGIEVIKEKVENVLRIKRPENVKELSSFLGMITYYGKFMKNLATIAEPLNRLKRKEEKWHWGSEQEKSFNELKAMLSSTEVLTHYKSDVKLKLDCDASSVGIGVVLSHVFDSGEEKPILYGSRTLNRAEKNYSQIEKEALSIVWGIKKCHQYLYGQRFLIVTDHKPLTTVFHPDKGISSTTTGRLTRWALFLSEYIFDITYRSTEKHGNADCLSRLPVSEKSEVPVGDPEVSRVNIQQIESTYFNVSRVREETRKDKVLSRVVQLVKQGWNDMDSNIGPEFLPYFQRREELCIEEDCVLWGTRLVVPRALKAKVVEILHNGHLGIVKMKGLARSKVWWPGCDKDIEDAVRCCERCKMNRNVPAGEFLHPFEYTSKPWERIHIDFAGPYLGKMWLIVVDSHSKYPEVVPMEKTTTISTIRQLKFIFARHGLPLTLVSDNGPQFVSEDFGIFLKEHGIKHIRTAPYHPSSNGQAERFVQSFKKAMKASIDDGKDVHESLFDFLLAYRSTPHSTTTVSPSMMLFKREIRSRIDIIVPNVKAKVSQHQQSQALHHDQHSRGRTFEVGNKVLARDYRSRYNRWKDGVIVEKTGPLSYRVDVGGMIWRRHVDQLIRNEGEKENERKQCMGGDARVSSKNDDENESWWNHDLCKPENESRASFETARDIGSHPLACKSTLIRVRAAPQRFSYDTLGEPTKD